MSKKYMHLFTFYNVFGWKKRCHQKLNIAGYCAVYDTQLHRVAENYEPYFECLKFPEDQKCPSRYPSTDAYKCKVITYYVCIDIFNFTQKKLKN